MNNVQQIDGGHMKYIVTVQIEPTVVQNQQQMISSQSQHQVQVHQAPQLQLHPRGTDTIYTNFNNPNQSMQNLSASQRSNELRRDLPDYISGPEREQQNAVISRPDQPQDYRFAQIPLQNYSLSSNTSQIHQQSALASNRNQMYPNQQDVVPDFPHNIGTFNMIQSNNHQFTNQNNETFGRSNNQNPRPQNQNMFSSIMDLKDSNAQVQLPKKFGVTTASKYKPNQMSNYQQNFNQQNSLQNNIPNQNQFPVSVVDSIQRDSSPNRTQIDQYGQLKQSFPYQKSPAKEQSVNMGQSSLSIGNQTDNFQQIQEPQQAYSQMDQRQTGQQYGESTFRESDVMNFKSSLINQQQINPNNNQIKPSSMKQSEVQYSQSEHRGSSKSSNQIQHSSMNKQSQQFSQAEHPSQFHQSSQSISQLKQSSAQPIPQGQNKSQRSVLGSNSPNKSQQQGRGNSAEHHNSYSKDVEIIRNLTQNYYEQQQPNVQPFQVASQQNYSFEKTKQQDQQITAQKRSNILQKNLEPWVPSIYKHLSNKKQSNTPKKVRYDIPDQADLSTNKGLRDLPSITFSNRRNLHFHQIEQVQEDVRIDIGNGAYYIGQMLNGSIEGIGTLYYFNDKKIYEGEWYNGHYHGKGCLNNLLAERIPFFFDFTNFSKLDNGWYKYEGQFEQSKMQGDGKLILTNGEIYEGQFLNDHIHGYGTFFRNDGERIQGVWQLNLLQSLQS